jgi:hypothetical protein
MKTEFGRSHERYPCSRAYTTGSQTVRRGLLVLGGGETCCLHKGRRYFQLNMGARQNIYFGMHSAWLKYFT